jgi:hypothetical protein
MLVAMAAIAAISAGVVVVLFGPDAEEVTEPNRGKTLPPTVGLENDIRFELLSARCGYEVVVTAETTVPPDNGQFCLVRLDVRNKGEVARSFDPSCQFLIDTTGSRHPQREDVLPLDADTADFFEQELPPKSVAQDIGLYYDVVKEIEAAEVELHTSCDSPGVRVEAVA